MQCCSTMFVLKRCVTKTVRIITNNLYTAFPFHFVTSSFSCIHDTLMIFHQRFSPIHYKNISNKTTALFLHCFVFTICFFLIFVVFDFNICCFCSLRTLFCFSLFPTHFLCILLACGFFYHCSPIGVRET